MKKLFTDSQGREFPYLRLSLTDVCNFSCDYCLPDGYKRSHQGEFLSHQEINHLVNAFSELGTKKVRITGGEPSLRKDFADIIKSVSCVEGIQKVATTTNGFRLQKDAQQWFDAGLDAINVSIDSLDAKTETDSTAYSVGANLTFTIFDGGLRSADIKKAAAMQRQAKLDINATKKRIKLEIENTYLEVGTQKSKLDALKDKLKYSNQRVD